MTVPAIDDEQVGRWAQQDREAAERMIAADEQVIANLSTRLVIANRRYEQLQAAIDIMDGLIAEQNGTIARLETMVDAVLADLNNYIDYFDKGAPRRTREDY